MGDRPCPGPVATRWPTIAALVVLVVNDHWAKEAIGNVVTGKLSGAAALVLCPLVAVGVVEWVTGRAIDRTRAVTLATTVGALAALAITVTETTVWGLHAYEVGVGALRWSLDALRALVLDAPLPQVHRVTQYQDLTDLLTLPAAALPALWLRSQPGAERPQVWEDGLQERRAEVVGAG